MPRVIRIRVPNPEEVLPEEFRVHVMNAYKELLLAVRSLIDEGIRRVEEMEKRSGKKEVKKIEIS